MEGRNAEIHIDDQLTEPGIRAARDAPKRSQAARETRKKSGSRIKEKLSHPLAKQIPLSRRRTLGESCHKFALATGSVGNVRTRTLPSWTRARMDQD